MRALLLIAVLLAGCGSSSPPAFTPRSGEVVGEPPSVVLLVAPRLSAADLEPAGVLGPLVEAGTRMSRAFARFDDLARAREDLRGLPGANGSGDLLERFAAGGYDAREVLPEACVEGLAGGGRRALRVVELPAERAAAVAADVVGAIDAAGLGDTTLVALVSLAGDPAAPPISERGLRVEMVLRLSGRLPAGEVRPQVVAHPDLAASLLDLCALGHELGDEAEGRSFARILQKSHHAWRGYVFARRSAAPPGEDVAWYRGSDWRLVWHETDGVTISWIREDVYRDGDDMGRPGAGAIAATLQAELSAWLGR